MSPNSQTYHPTKGQNNMLGVIVNVITVLIGCTIGLIFRKGISQKISTAAMTAIGLCNLCIGVAGMMEGNNAIVLIVSMVLGTIIGTAIDIDSKLNSFGDKASARFKRADSSGSHVSEAFITASLVFCVGSMTILGGLNAGIKGDNTLYYTKAVLDLISSAMLTTSLGFGVVFAVITVFVYQGALVLLASLLAPVLTTAIIAELNCVGSVMIFALGLNLAGVSKFKVANFLPAIVLVPLVCALVSFITPKS